MERQNLLSLVVILLCLVAVVLSATLVNSLVLGGSSGGKGTSTGVGDTGVTKSNVGRTTSPTSLQTPDSTKIGGGEITSSQSPKVLFTVESDKPGYWRQDSYSRYTGSGWAKTSSSISRRERINRYLTGSERNPRSAEKVRQFYSIPKGSGKIIMGSAPSIWKPRSIEGLNRGVEVSSSGGIKPSRALDNGDTYSVVSLVDRPSVSDLKNAGKDYPSGLYNRYTQLPSDFPSRVESFTNKITSGAETPYGKAVAIEKWLESNKEYSLNVDRPSGDVTEGFLFDMDKGYCQYFATSMATMLRSQGIPARYVVGFSPGQRMSEDKYVVRAMNAHAWVEVYFPDEGWVRFDPTPPDTRRQSEARSLMTARGRNLKNADISGSRTSNYAKTPGVPGSPQERRKSNEPKVTRGDVPDDIRLVVKGKMVPGNDVIVKVKKAGTQNFIEGVRVTFNGRSVGVTNSKGAVNATVPYTKKVVVGVGTPQDDKEKENYQAPGGLNSDFFYSSEPVKLSLSSNPLSVNQEPNSSEVPREYKVKTDLELKVNGGGRTFNKPKEKRGIEFSGVLRPGKTAEVEFLIEGVPVRNAQVFMNGESVGRTDKNGKIKLDIPKLEKLDPSSSKNNNEKKSGKVTLSISRGELSWDRTFEVSEAPNLIPPILFFPMLGLAGILGGVFVYRRYGWESGTAKGYLSGFVEFVKRVIIRLRKGILEGLVNISNFLADLVSLLSQGISGVWSWVKEKDLNPIRLIFWLWNGVVWVKNKFFAIPFLVLGLLKTENEESSDSEEESSSVQNTTPDQPGSRSDSREKLSVEEAWREMTKMVPIRPDDSVTPGEYARKGVEAGMPKEAVWKLTDVFRKVRYSERDETPERRNVALDSLDEIKSGGK